MHMVPRPAYVPKVYVESEQLVCMLHSQQYAEPKLDGTFNMLCYFQLRLAVASIEEILLLS